MIKTPFSSKKMPETGSIKPMVSAKVGHDLERHVQNQELRMGFWDQFKFSRKASEITAEKLGEITIALVEKQRDEIFQKLMLELDINKKRTYAEYMENVGHLNKDLVLKSNRMERELRTVMREEIEQIYKEQEAWIKMIEGMNLSNEDRAHEMERIKDWIALACGQVDGKISTLVETHSASLKVTLELLKNEAIKADDALGLGGQSSRG
jgi:hypothetical protein